MQIFLVGMQKYLANLTTYKLFKILYNPFKKARFTVICILAEVLNIQKSTYFFLLNCESQSF